MKKEVKALEELQKTDPEAFLEKLESQDKTRIKVCPPVIVGLEVTEDRPLMHFQLILMDRRIFESDDPHLIDFFLCRISEI